MKNGPVGVVSLVCITCGNENHYDQAVPPSPTCQTCGGTVFRQFATPTEPDEASIAQLEAQARSIALDDDAPQTAPDDVRDLNTR